MVHLPHYQPPPGTKVPKGALKKPKAPKAGKAPISRKAAAERLSTIRAQNITQQKAHQDRLLHAESVLQKQALANRQMEHDRLAGAYPFSSLSAQAIGRYEDLKKLLEYEMAPDPRTGLHKNQDLLSAYKKT